MSRQGDRWGLAALAYEADGLSMALSAPKAHGSTLHHSAILTATMRVAGRVNGGHLDGEHAYMILSSVVAAAAPERMAEFTRAWRSALVKAEPRHPATEGDATGWLGAERRTHALTWLQRGPGDDPAIAQGGTRGATALAICTYFAGAFVRSGRSSLRETYAGMAKVLPMQDRTIERTRRLWGRWVNRSATGKRSPGQTPEHSVYVLAPLANPPHPAPSRVAEEVYEIGPSAGGTRRAPDGYRTNFVHPFLLEPSDFRHLPWASRWSGRTGRLGPWRIWHALDPEDERTPAEVVATTGMHRQTVHRHLALMVSAGEVTRPEDGRYLRSLGPSVYDQPDVDEALWRFHRSTPDLIYRAWLVHNLRFVP